MGLVYLPTFSWFFMVNVGKYTIHGCYGSPSGDPPPVVYGSCPSVMPILSEPRAQAAFIRMMARASRSGSRSQAAPDLIILDP